MTTASQTALEKVRLLKAIDFKPHPAQQALFDDNHRFKVISCGRRFGKTVYAVNKMIRDALFTTNGDYYFISPTYRQSKEIAWRTLFQYLPPEMITKVLQDELSVTLKNGSRISLKGADNPDALRGVALDGVILDEYAFMSPEAWNIISPMLQDRKGWAVFISTPNGYHNHFYSLYTLEGKDPDFKSFHFTSYDNPYLDPNEIEKERLRMTPEKFEREYLAEFTKRSGAIWLDFSRDTHCVDRRPPDPDSTIYGSIDFGFATGHDTSFLLHEVTSTGEIYTFDGFNTTGKTIQDLNNMMRDLITGLSVTGLFADPARPDLIAELQRLNWAVLPVIKDVELGIAKVAEYMKINPATKKPRWTISKHLTRAIEQIEDYCWTQVRNYDGEFKNAPRKENDDACDSLRYFLFNYGKDPVPKSDQYFLNNYDHIMQSQVVFKKAGY